MSPALLYTVFSESYLKVWIASLGTISRQGYSPHPGGPRHVHRSFPKMAPLTEGLGATVLVPVSQSLVLHRQGTRSKDGVGLLSGHLELIPADTDF